MTRCVNIDWLECYCLEDSIGYPHNADYFRAKGWTVNEREYGTPMYNEMFTVYGVDGLAYAEIRRAPKSDKRSAGIFSPYAAHVRLVNRSCYADEAARLLQLFLETYGFAFQRISRIDICYDFEYFDYGDEPRRFLSRFMKGRYSKINQANIAAHGLDGWDGRDWNSVSWGAPSSMVRTRFYNKSKEIKEVKDKPYIRQAWQIAGLVDDMATLEKHRKDGKTYKPEIWRIEFAIKSGTKKWFVVEDYNGDRKKILSKPNTLDVYYTRKQIFQVFLSLAHHYFHFKIVEYKSKSRALIADAISVVTIDENHPLAPLDWRKSNRELQRKDRCKDKELFKKSELDTYYTIEKLCTDKPRPVQLDQLLTLLYEYRQTHYEDKVVDACNVLISKLERDRRLTSLASPFTKKEIDILQQVLAIRLKDKGIELQKVKDYVTDMVEKERSIWSNPY